MNYRVIGIMSGTSHDGLDIAYCEFEKNSSSLKYKMLSTQTFTYPEEWLIKLKEAPKMSSEKLIKNHFEYGHFIGQKVLDFLKNNNLEKPDIIASHGHTVFHQPENGFTFQLGCGSAIAAQTRTVVVSDFRAMNIAFGGQGAPLVPIGDELLFPEYHFCLNIGGFINISYKNKGKRVAFDVCPANFLINHISQIKQKEICEILNVKKADFDIDGTVGRHGKVCESLLNDLNNIEYYNKSYPKSIGAEWFNNIIIPIIEKYKLLSAKDILRTVYEHITFQLSKVVNDSGVQGKMLITGGGAKNLFLMELLRSQTNLNIQIPNNKIVDYKEALVFALLGLLRVNNEKNTYKSASGGIDCSGGIISNGT